MSMKLAKHLYENYNWSLIGTIALTEKKQRADEDVPSLKLSNEARNMLSQGWFHEAYIKMTTCHQKMHYI
jgi:hypothetical protein